ncbi:uncharacterized protein F5891DRAFT_492171 [Suillus fuscotomentosus]|uniref:F-box domain-containing protein n=1 Tax=Suillus fuscotomentosus TaxID=1912939 RepID=A0AAD4E1V8_9AGAM|nr:uncharacterized protein F5891DRAFT_492171 [Suillus fuscotomentosus]KAG1898223.1 hypothetical protein F5891DRAFT_492171 [Suillus fuscotomentosus]
MHTCLQISEILRIIFAEVTQVTGGGVQPSYALYHLALTCRAFREPALDALWAHIPTPDVLVMCLPQDARSQPMLKMTMENFDQFECTPSGIAAAFRVRLLRPLTTDDWATFQMYARRVRSLTFAKYDAESYALMRDRGLHDSAALALLGSPALPFSPFPLLRELYWNDQRDVLLPCLQRCISNSLTRLVIHSELWPSAMVDLVAGLGKACPMVKEFRCSMPPASACAMISDIVTYWDDLEILEMGVVNAQQALQHLASLEKLRELKMLVPEGHSLDEDLASTFSVKFSLDEFSITAARIEPLLAFLAPLKISAKSANLKIDTASNADDLGQLLSSLIEHFYPNVLESLDVWMARPTDPTNHALSELSASIFQKIRAFTGLTNLNLSSIHASMTDHELLDLISAWPKMEHFYLNTAWDWGVARLRVTFHGLAGILERCPNLRSLGVDLDTSPPHDPPVYVDNQYTGIARDKVTELNVGSAECNDVETIGSLLAEMCPNLISIGRACPVNLNYEDPSANNEWFDGEAKWEEVRGFIAQRRSGQLEQNNV